MPTKRDLNRCADVLASAVTSAWFTRYMAHVDEGLLSHDAAGRADEEIADAIEQWSGSKTEALVGRVVETPLAVFVAGLGR